MIAFLNSGEANGIEKLGYRATLKAKINGA
jgi:hypothetical protein